MFGIGIHFNIRQNVTDTLNRINRVLRRTEEQSQQTASEFQGLSSVMSSGSNFSLTENELTRVNNLLNDTSREGHRFNQRMQQMTQMSGQMSEGTKMAYATLFTLNQEVSKAKRTYGAYSQEVLEARDRLNQFAMGLDDVAFKQIYMRSQLGLTEPQLRQQANSIRLNARMNKIMGDGLQVIKDRLKGLQELGIKPEDFLPPSTPGQFQIMNEAMEQNHSVLNRLSAGYRRLGNNVEGVIKNYSTMKVATRLANGDLVRQHQLNTNFMARLGDMSMAFPVVGLSALTFYGGLVSYTVNSNEKTKQLAETVGGKLAKAFAPMLEIINDLVTKGLEFVSMISDWIIKFNEAHPVCAKFVQGLLLILPALTMLFMPLSMGAGLVNGLMMSLNALWTSFGGVIMTMGVASSSAILFMGAIAILGRALIEAYHHSENFRNVVDTVVTFIQGVATSVFEAFGDTITRVTGWFKGLGDAILDGGIVGGLNYITNSINNFITNFIEGGGFVGAFKRMVQDIQNTFKELNFEEVKQVLRDMVTSFKTEFIPQFLESGKALMSSLMEGIKVIGKDLVNIWDSIISPFINNIIASLPKLHAKGIELLDNIVQGLLVGIPKFVEIGANWINSLLVSLQTNSPMLLGVVNDLIEMLVLGLIVGIPMLLNLGFELIKFLVEGIVQSMPVLIQLGGTLLVALLEGLVSMLPMLLTVGLDIIFGLVDIILENLPVIVMGAIAIIMALAEGLLQALPMIITVAGEIISQLIVVLIQFAPQILGCGLLLIGQLAVGLLQALPQIVGAILNIIAISIGTLMGAIGQFIMAGFELILNVGKGMLNAVGNVISNVGDIINQAIEKAKSFKGKFIEAGKSIITGLADGIKNGISSVVNAVGDTVGRAIQKGKEILGINSPSKVFRKFGRGTSEGYALGVKDEKDVVINSVDNMAKSSVEVAHRVLGGKSLDFSPQITPIIDIPKVNLEEYSIPQSPLVVPKQENTPFINKVMELPKEDNIINIPKEKEGKVIPLFTEQSSNTTNVNETINNKTDLVNLSSNTRGGDSISNKYDYNITIQADTNQMQNPQMLAQQIYREIQKMQEKENTMKYKKTGLVF